MVARRARNWSPPIYILNDLAPNNECFELMQKLIEYRQDGPVRDQLSKVDRHSMLHVDVLALIHYFAKSGEGHILEIGSFVGGSTIAAALGARDSGKFKKIISIEVGGRLKKHRLATRNIVKQLKKNLARFAVLDAVTLINGPSYEEKTIAAVRQALGPNDVGLFIFDADDNVRRDLDCYGDRLSDRCWVVIDDYLGRGEKTGSIQKQVDGLMANGRLLQLGFFGLGTWIGRWQRTPIGEHGSRQEERPVIGVRLENARSELTGA
jgi:predicted O-methyltransferase YrrM